MSPPVALQCSRPDNKIIGQTTGGGKFQISLARLRRSPDLGYDASALLRSAPLDERPGVGELAPQLSVLLAICRGIAYPPDPGARHLLVNAAFLPLLDGHESSMLSGCWFW